MSLNADWLSMIPGIPFFATLAMDLNFIRLWQSCVDLASQPRRVGRQDAEP